MDPVETKAPIDSEVLEENKSSSTESTVATDDDHVPVENNSSSSVSTTYNSRQSIDEKYTIALDEGRFTAYQQIVTGKGSAATVAFFAITLKSEGSIACANETQSAHFQHGDILKDHIFMIAVSKETTNSDVHLVFVRKEWFFNLYDRLISEKKTISSSATLFEKGKL